MGLNLSNKVNFHFICTNYGSNQDGIGHYTSKIVNELQKNKSFLTYVYSKNTSHLSKFKLFLSIGMTKQILKVIKNIFRRKQKNFIVLEYPFVEYNPLFFLALLCLKITKNKNSKIVMSLHEYSRTKKLRKLFIELLIPFCDIVLYTREDDIKPFKAKKIHFKQRIIPANIEPLKEEVLILKEDCVNICFFGIINFETKEIDTMIKAWEMYSIENNNSKICFHFISSSYNKAIENNINIKYYYNLKDADVSRLLVKMTYIILPLKPRISINNGSLSVGCIHKCIPIGVFDHQYFNDDFGITMNNYSTKEFMKVYKVIENLNINTLKNKQNIAFTYGKARAVKNSVLSYLDLINLPGC
jgi:hypothetical protein